MKELSGSLFWLAAGVIVLSAFIILFLQTLHDAGIRRLFNRAWTFSWLEAHGRRGHHRSVLVDLVLFYFVMLRSYRVPLAIRNAWDEIGGGRRDSAAFSLPYAQFCGHLSSLLQALLESRRPSAMLEIVGVHPRRVSASEASNDAEVAEVADDYRLLETAVDELQVYLSARWRAFDYIASFGLAYLFVTVLNRWTPFPAPSARSELGSMVVFLSVTAALLVPHVRPLIERLLKGRF